jgi:hypothetical protein
VVIFSLLQTVVIEHTNAKHDERSNKQNKIADIDGTDQSALNGLKMFQN